MGIESLDRGFEVPIESLVGCVVNCLIILSIPLLARWLWSLLIHRGSKLKNSPTKWQSPWRIVELNRRIILPLLDDMISPSVVSICSDSWIYRLLIWTPLSLFHSPRHDSRRRSLSMLVLSHSNTHYLNGHMVFCGCHEILIPLCYPDEVFCLGQKSINSSEILYLDAKKNAQRWQSDTNWRHKKINSGDRKCKVPRNIDPLLWNCHFLDLISLNGLQLPLKSLFLYFSVRRLILVAVDSLFKIEKFLLKMAISFSDLRS